VTLNFDPIDEAGRQWRERFPPEYATPMMAVTSVMRVQQLWLGRCNEVLAPFGLTFSRYEALTLLSFARGGALPLGKIGARLQVHPTSVTNVVDGLERDGLVERIPHPSDRRTTLARITDTGREVAASATAALHEVRFGTELSDAALAEITGLLRRERLDAGDFTAP
jgi:DNA-binding MarR family transcriptional regulator